MIFIQLSQSWHVNPPEHSSSNYLVSKMPRSGSSSIGQTSEKIFWFAQELGRPIQIRHQRDTALRFTAGASLFLDLSRSMSLSSRYSRADGA